jgi:sigma-B regulation protein RsbU (phosphoserine phosphatase)
MIVNPAVALSLRDQLLDRRARIEEVVATVGAADDMVRLLQQVDAALARVDAGTYGGCEICGGSVEDERLQATPMLQYCLCDLTAEQQTKLEQDLELAWRIQSALLPKQNQRFAGWEVHYRYLPAGPVSGDFCDVVTRQAGNGADVDSLLFLLGDVSGKGVAASFLMAHLNALFRSLVEADQPLPELVERANRIFSESTLSTHYATLVCGRATATGALEICNAGHCPPLVMRAGKVAPVESTGLPVGILESSPYETLHVELDPGDSLFLYSDGLTEAVDAADEQYGDARLAEQLAAGHQLGPAELAASCLEHHRWYRGDQPRQDDLTVMVIRRTG